MTKTSPAAWIVLLLSLAIGLASLRYALPGSPAAPPQIVANAFTRYGALAVHIACATTALLIGPLQFLPRLRARLPRWHRIAGRTYVASCLAGGAAGLLLALGTTAGPVATAGFGLLAVSWMFCTANAWRFARARDFERHPRWMIRSFALTFAAVTLRAYLPISGLLHLDFAASYVAISFLCWIPNLAIAELYLARRGSLRAIPPIAASSQSPG
jgi:uncharacterized membrane protein